MSDALLDKLKEIKDEQLDKEAGLPDRREIVYIERNTGSDVSTVLQFF